MTFGMCARSLWFNNIPGSTQKRLLGVAAVLLLVFATANVAFSFRHVLDAFIYYTGPGGPAQHLAVISNWVNVMKVPFAYRCRIVHH